MGAKKRVSRCPRIEVKKKKEGTKMYLLPWICLKTGAEKVQFSRKITATSSIR